MHKKSFLALMLGIVVIGFTPSALYASSGGSNGSNEGSPKRGKTWYFDAGCDGCHGKRGKGNGPAAAALNPKPANFCKSTKHPTDILKFKMIAEGGASMGHSPAMPAWGGVLDKQVILDLIAYIHTLCKK